MRQLLSLVKSRKVGFVVVAKLDRLTRSVRDLDELLTLFRKYKVELFSLSEFLNTATAMGRFALNMMVVVSQWEREAIGERTREALGHKRANRLRAGNIPYGFRLSADKQHVEPDKSEHEIIATIQKLRARGLTLRDIAAELNKRGHCTRRGSYWRHEYVKRVLGGVSK
jgi:DNA invertase Pin-like site-specific DNA recombinase